MDAPGMRRAHRAAVRRRGLLPAAIALCAVVRLLGCGSPDGPSAPPTEALGAVDVTILWSDVTPGGAAGIRSIPASTQTIELTITGAGISPDITRAITKSDVVVGEATVRLYVPPGTGRLFRALAKDAEGIILVGGSNTLDVAAGVVTTAGVELGPPKDGKIAFASAPCAPSGDAGIYTMNANGSGLTRLSGSGIYDAAPEWSPDGSKIAFFSARDGNDEIYVMDADGSNPVNLTNNTSFDSAPSWSPDGGRIVFASDRDGAAYEIYVMDADGGNVFRLPGEGFYPSWSPDGRRIVFQTSRDGNGEIYVMDDDGGNPVNLTQSPGDDQYPAWSPDGSKIAFGSNRDGDYDIYLMDADGGNPVDLLPSPGGDYFPTWSPDGSKILFALGSSPAQLYTIAPDGSNLTLLPSTPDTVKCGPDWQPLY